MDKGIKFTIRFTSGGVLYKLSGIKEWICENDISE